MDLDASVERIMQLPQSFDADIEGDLNYVPGDTRLPDVARPFLLLSAMRATHPCVDRRQMSGGGTFLTTVPPSYGQLRRVMGGTGEASSAPPA